MFTNKEKNSETKDYLEILTKMLELEKQKKKINPLKITICIVGGIGCVMFIGILCYSIVKSEFSLDSILSTLLAFFSIFISIFFYFKADETSTNFYNSSYEFMKDISVTLGKIEERFGEKLNSLNDKISHLDRISNETSEEIEGKKDDKDRKELAEKEAEIEMLRNHKYLAEREARKLRNQIVRIQNEQDDFPLPPKDMLEDLLRTHDTSDITSLGMRRLQKLGIIDADGRINEHSIIRLMDTYYS